MTDQMGRGRLVREAIAAMEYSCSRALDPEIRADSSTRTVTRRETLQSAASLFSCHLFRRVLKL